MIVGIDFGTTNLRIAAIVDGRPVILENPEGEGTTPAAVSFRPDGEVLVGSAAKRDAALFPETVIRTAKRLIGRKFDDPLTRLLRASLPIEISDGVDGYPLIEVRGQPYTPTQICRRMFAALRDIAQQRTGRPVFQAAVAVPAYFGSAERAAIAHAASQAGLDVVRMVSEPTAAALFYGYLDKTSKTIAIYDLGGGTFDFSILSLEDGVVEVLATGGDTFLGGEDFDFRIVSAVLEREALRLDELTPSARERLKSAAEDAKITLCGTEITQIFLKRLALIDGREIDIEFELTRTMLQGLCQDLVDRTLAMCRLAIDDIPKTAHYRAHFTVTDIDEIILVGGATRLPFIEESVERFFRKEPRTEPRREDAVALGTAIQAGVMDGSVKDVLLLDVLPRALGVRVRGCPIIVMDRHTPIPYRVDFGLSEKRQENEGFLFELFEGELDAGEELRILDVFDLSGEADGKNWLRASVSLDVDAAGGIHFSLRDGQNGTLFERSYKERVTETRPIDVPKLDREVGELPAVVHHGSEIAAPEPAADRLCILAVATEWRSGAGGLSTFNRSLCTALAAAGHDVQCLALDLEESDFLLAKLAGVSLIEVPRHPGFSDQLSLARKPKLPDGWTPDIIIGHGRVTGPMAHSIAEDHFPHARRLHVVHMAPDEIEWHKPDRGDDAGVRAADRMRIEYELSRLAAFAAAVGPRLHERFLRDLHPMGVKPLRLDPGFDSKEFTPLGPPPGKVPRILIAGRAEDVEIKGLDIAAAAFADLSAKRASHSEIELLVRGAPKGQAELLRRRLLDDGGVPGANIVVRPFDGSAAQMNTDFQSSSVVLMPSRAEGFGLVGLEAIMAGVPLLLSSESGLAGLLKEKLGAADWQAMIVPVTNDISIDRRVWEEAIALCLRDREAAFERVAKVREALMSLCSWEQSVAALLKAMKEAWSR